MPYGGVNLYLDVALSFQDLHWEVIENDVYVFAPPILRTSNTNSILFSGRQWSRKILWERGTQTQGSSSTPGKFFFQRQLPLDQRA